MNNLIDRLRRGMPSILAMRDAADEIEHLRGSITASQARVKELEDALRPLVKNIDMLCYKRDDDLTLDNLRIGDVRRAVKLLERK